MSFEVERLIMDLSRLFEGDRGCVYEA